MISPRQRFSRDNPCPICSGFDRMPRGQGKRCSGFLSEDGRFALCSREEHAGGLSLAGDSDCYPHRLGPGRHDALGQEQPGCDCGLTHSADPAPAPRPPRHTAPREPRTELVAYPWQAWDGALLYENVRSLPKDFHIRRPRPGHPPLPPQEGPCTGAHQTGLASAERVPYRLPDLLRDPADRGMVLVVEGEKAVNRLRDREKLPATTCLGGAGKWWDTARDGPREECIWLTRRAGQGSRDRVPVVIGDDDFAGREGAEKAIRAFQRSGLQPRLVILPGQDTCRCQNSRDCRCPGRGVDDWLDAGHTKGELLALCAAAQPCPDIFNRHHPLLLAVAAPGQDPEEALAAWETDPLHPPSPLEAMGDWGEDADARFTDVRNGLRLTRSNLRELRFDFTREKWRGWQNTRKGGYWRLEETEGAVARATEEIRHWYGRLGRIDDEDARKHAFRAIVESEGAGRVAAMLKLARPFLSSTQADYDQDPWLLNTHGGVVELRTGRIRQGWPEDMLSKITSCDCDPERETPLWDATLDIALGPRDRGLIAFFQRAIGLALIGEVMEHRLFVMHGTGANLKSTLLTTCIRILGDYARQAAPDVLLEQQRDRHPEAIADLAGVRFVSTQETRQGTAFDEAMVKTLTGGDPRSCRHLYGPRFVYTPSDTFFLATNERPRVRGTDEGIWRRLCLLPFTRTLEPERRMPEAMVHDLLRPEYPGILWWMIRGCLEYQRVGLAEPDEVKGATQGYRREQDLVSDWLEARCVVGAGYWASTQDLYRSYSEWCRDANLRPMSLPSFTTRLRGLPDPVTAHQYGAGRGWDGLGLIGAAVQGSL